MEIMPVSTMAVWTPWGGPGDVRRAEQRRGVDGAEGMGEALRWHGCAAAARMLPQHTRSAGVCAVCEGDGVSWPSGPPRRGCPSRQYLGRLRLGRHGGQG